MQCRLIKHRVDDHLLPFKLCNDHAAIFSLWSIKNAADCLQFVQLVVDPTLEVPRAQETT